MDQKAPKHKILMVLQMVLKRRTLGKELRQLFSLGTSTAF